MHDNGMSAKRPRCRERRSSMRWALEAGQRRSRSAKLARIQKNNLHCFALEDSHCHPASQCEHIDHVYPEAAAGSVVGLVEEGDIIKICFQEGRIHLAVSDEQQGNSRGWRPPRAAAKGGPPRFERMPRWRSSAATGRRQCSISQRSDHVCRRTI
ncbi:dihydroxy-acid dehydratase [Bradyrhizobium sp. AUGA SZCCT0283]|uniref:dihydroxy-acid dehydratase domain-containing protein n=1 Tax=Bradyrhizobium sp. AUGA SZCCT0283 TaxID=2807671 RepID=UPI001BA70147|nr:dihydroxy-acid dehydratase [Bradyrhizobium sp. AUGA SZCCT0283]MBR1273319.1 dihydroxy-acid dehydratase [Bradyrhizobium sp. AUGA SZCCT0283]